MKITTKQREDMRVLLEEQLDNLVELTTQGLAANANHVRPANINLIIKVARNTDDPGLIEVSSQRKIKAPKSRMSDLTSWDETEVLMSFRLGEVPGQQKLDD